MRRSEINNLIRESLTFFERMQWRLPPWGYWSPSDWRGKGVEANEVIDNMLGWDLTDFGGGDFSEKGLILFTLRNGNQKKGDPKTYAEKIMIAREGQETPMHFHWSKMEDIINRGGGNLVLQLYGATVDEQLSTEQLDVSVDGVRRTVQPGGLVVLKPGESICLERRMYHRFYGEMNKGVVLIGEVSAVNDDTSDNRFFEPQGRFPSIIEDELPNHLLVNDYKNFL